MTLHTTAIALLAAAGLTFAGGAHAQQTGTSSPGGTPGRSCDDDGRTMADGDLYTYKTKGQKGSVTCTDGTICHTWKVRQAGTKWTWFSECRDSPART